jgi:hypothetical protein
MTIAIVVVVALLGVGLALSQLMRMKAYLDKPQPELPPEPREDGDT